MTDGHLLERFAAERDEAAFEAIVRRHGPVVLRICREILSDPHEAEDAFQATFLVLVRNARSIRDRDSLGRWLCEVAYRVSLRARGHVVRRRVRERQGVEMAAAGSGPDPARNELLPLVRAEVQRLPERFRAPVILCYLEGCTQEEAARRLDCPLGTLKGRLTRGREILRSRLSRRGLAVTSALLMLLLGREASADVPEELIRSTVGAALREAARLDRRRGPIVLIDGRRVAVVLLSLVILGNAVWIARSSGATRKSLRRNLSVFSAISDGTCH